MDMVQQKRTQKSLLASGVSLLTCVALLIGTTFAWFTDNVTSGRNTITAGNLDVELYAMDDAGDYQPVRQNESLFDDKALWEPGHTEVVYLKVANEGTLALKYQLAVTVADETSGTNVDGEAFNLSDYLMFDAVEGQNTKFATRDAALAAVPSATPLNDYTNPGNLTAGAEEYIALVVYMPEGVGNKANYKTGTTAPSIQLGVSVTATQDKVESDSFGTDYDADVDLLAADLTNKLAAGGNVRLEQNVDVLPDGPDKGAEDDVIPQMVVSEDTTFDLSGKSLSVDEAAFEESLPYTPALIVIENGATMTIDGNGIITAEAGYNNSYGINVNGGSLVINDGNYYGAMTAVQVQKGSLVINGGFFDMAPTCKAAVPQYAKYIINAIDSAYKDGSATIEIKGGTFVNFDPSSNPEGTGTSYLADGYIAVGEKQANGETWYTVVKGEQAASEDALETALENAGDGDTIALTQNVTLTQPLTIDKAITIVGTDAVSITGSPIHVNANVTFKNTVLTKPTNDNKNATLVYGGTGCETLVFEGCTFSDPQWEAIQITSASFKSLTVNNCIFTAANVDGAESSYGNTADQAIRYIHIEPNVSANVVADITITNNTFKNCDKVKDSVVGIYFVDGSTITVGGNTFEELVGEGETTSEKLSVGWPMEEELEIISNWTGENRTFTINA